VNRRHRAGNRSTTEVRPRSRQYVLPPGVSRVRVIYRPTTSFLPPGTRYRSRRMIRLHLPQRGSIASGHSDPGRTLVRQQEYMDLYPSDRAIQRCRRDRVWLSCRECHRTSRLSPAAVANTPEFFLSSMRIGICPWGRPVQQIGVNVPDLLDFANEGLDFRIEVDSISVLHHGRSQHVPSWAQTPRARIRLKRSRQDPAPRAAGVPSPEVDARCQFMTGDDSAEMATCSDILRSSYS
jgi:hypothetical protein